MKGMIYAALAAATMLSSAAQADEVIFAHGANPGNPRYVAAEKWSELLPPAATAPIRSISRLPPPWAMMWSC